LKNKPYPKGNAPRPVKFKATYSKRKGKSDNFSADASVQHKGFKGSLGYSTSSNKLENPYVSEQYRGKNLRASATVPLGKGVSLSGNISRNSGKGKYQVDAPDYKGSGSYREKPTYSYGAGIEAPLLGGRASLNASRTPGQPSIGRKQESYIGGRLTLPFNKGGKVKAKSKRVKKKK